MRMYDQHHSKRGGSFQAVVMTAVLAGASILLAATGRPIIKDGTVKTADGQLIRGCCAHIGKCTTPAVRSFFTDINNVKRLRDEAHLNAIRITWLDPWAREGGWGGGYWPVLDSALPYYDKIIANCESLGVVPIVNYHFPRISQSTDPNSEMGIMHFWDVMAARYKDHPAVIYETYNENFYQLQLQEGWDNPSDPENAKELLADIYINHIRKWAPDNLVLGAESMGIEAGQAQPWMDFLTNKYAPALGFTWNSGKDAWPFHAYASSSTPSDYPKFKAAGIPIINTEWTMVGEGADYGVECWSSMGVCEAGEWFEKNGISWIIWQKWQSRASDQLASIMSEIIKGDAVTKKYAWWNAVSAITPQRPARLPASVIKDGSDALNYMSTDGRIVKRGAVSTDKLRSGVYLTMTAGSVSRVVVE